MTHFRRNPAERPELPASCRRYGRLPACAPGEMKVKLLWNVNVLDMNANDIISKGNGYGKRNWNVVGICLCDCCIGV